MAGPDGKFQGLVASLRDLSQEKQTEAELRQMLESIGDGFFAVDGEWRLVYVKSMAARLLNINHPKVFGKSYREIFPLRLGMGLAADYRRAAGGEIRDFENCYAPWGCWFYHKRYSRAGEGISVYFEDITKCKQIEAELQLKEAELREAQRMAQIGSWYWDATTNEITGSEEFWHIYGIDPAQAPMLSFQAPKGYCDSVEDWERVNEAIQKTLQTGVGCQLGCPVFKNGARRWLTMRSTAVKDVNERIPRGCAAFCPGHYRAQAGRGRVAGERSEILHII